MDYNDFRKRIVHFWVCKLESLWLFVTNITGLLRPLSLYLAMTESIGSHLTVTSQWRAEVKSQYTEKRQEAYKFLIFTN